MDYDDKGIGVRQPGMQPKDKRQTASHARPADASGSLSTRDPTQVSSDIRVDRSKFSVEDEGLLNGAVAQGREGRFSPLKPHAAENGEGRGAVYLLLAGMP